MSSELLNQLQSRVLLLDGAMGSKLQLIDLDVENDYLGHENCVDILVKSRPELIETIHLEFLAAGADMVETNTFGANKLVFSEFDEELVGLTREVNLARAFKQRDPSPLIPGFWGLRHLCVKSGCFPLTPPSFGRRDSSL